MVRVRPYVRVTGNLSLTVTELSANIPAFNPQKLLADSVGANDQTPAAAPDAEVTFVTCDLAVAPRPNAKSTVAVPVTSAGCDLASLLPKVKLSTQLSLEAVMPRVRDIAMRANAGPSVTMNADGTPNLKLSYAAEGDTNAFFSFQPRVVPENVTLLPKTTSALTNGGDWSERLIPVKRGETVGSILRELGGAPDEIKSIIAVIGPAALEGGLKEGQKLRVLLTPAGIGHNQPLRVIIAGDSGITAATALSDLGSYVPVDIRNIDTDVAETGEDQNDDDSSGVRLYQSLYETALRNNVPNPVIAELVRIYSYDVDFQRKVQPGDSFDVLYSDDEGGGGDNKYEVRFASMTVGGDTKKYYRFQTADDGAYDYYDEDGVSSKKFLVRKPVADGIVTSPFGWRTHPMLHVSELHSGVDWGAPYGTPIFAAGNGDMEEMGLKGGYGKYVRIRHNNGYETAYGHMTRVRPRPQCRQPCPPGSDHRLRRFVRHVDRIARAFRNHRQRSFRRSDARQTPARPRARRRDARGFRQRPRAARCRAIAHTDRPRRASALIYSVIASEAKQSSLPSKPPWIASSLRSSQ